MQTCNAIKAKYSRLKCVLSDFQLLSYSCDATFATVSVEPRSMWGTDT